MSSATNCLVSDLQRDGFVLLPEVFSTSEVQRMRSALESALATDDEPAIRGDEGAVYAARNVLVLWPEVASVWKKEPLTAALHAALGPDFGLVRVLYFDKPPGQSWSLPWHKDLTVAVRNNRLPSPRFRRPTAKAGVPHVEAPEEVLERMLTARIHLDPVTDENGPLKVVPGSQYTGKRMDLDGAAVRVVYAAAGDVLLVRPLVAHCSNRSQADTTRHRRILHLEFAGTATLPDGYDWHDYVR
jgi:hypothetical protein